MQEIDQIIDTRISVEWLILADAAEVTVEAQRFCPLKCQGKMSSR